MPLLACLSTPGPALERIEDGADLMIPGVKAIFHHSATIPTLGARSVVGVTPLGSKVPVAVGRLLAPLKDIVSALQLNNDTKGKAVEVLHVYKDHLWAMGSKAEPPSSIPAVDSDNKSGQAAPSDEDAGSSGPVNLLPRPEGGQAEDDTLVSATEDLKIDESKELDMTPAGERHPFWGLFSSYRSMAEVDTALHLALLSCIAKTLPRLPDALPCPAGTFLTAFVQPSRPYGTPTLDLRKSTFKTFTKFLKSAEKDGLLKMKEVNNVVMVMSVNAAHESLATLPKFGTVGEAEEKERLKVEKQKKQEGIVAPMEARELWKPHGTTIALFEACGKS